MAVKSYNLGNAKMKPVGFLKQLISVQHRKQKKNKIRKVLWALVSGVLVKSRYCEMPRSSFWNSLPVRLTLENTPAKPVNFMCTADQFQL